jgi:hypothetical protein
MIPKPTVIVTTTTPDGARWLASGTVQFSLSPDGGDILPSAMLSFDFHRAQDETHAIQQAAAQLQQVAEAFLAVAKHHQQR